MRAALTVLLAVVTAVGVASAQAADTVRRGTRVRITPSTPSSVIVGELIGASDSVLVVRTQGYRGDVTIARAAVMRLEVSRGTRGHTSAGWGALIGMGIGGLAGFAAGEDRCGGDAWFCIKRPLAAVLGGATGVATGSLIGLIVGSFERWSDSAVPVSLSVAPTGGGSLSVAGRIAF
jgi:hypothetical protein